MGSNDQLLITNFCIVCKRDTHKRKITFDSKKNLFFFCVNCKKVWCLTCMASVKQKSPEKIFRLGNKGKVKCPKCERTLNKQKNPKDLPFKQIRTDIELDGILQDDITEILEMIDTNKYSDILNNLEKTTICYQLIYIIENILRRFIQNILLKAGYSQLQNLKDRTLNNIIKKFKNQESKQKYLPVRGDHDIFYLNFKQLNWFFDKHWKYFKDIFESRTWITQRIKDLYDIRNRVAHNSYLLTEDELIYVKVYSKQIIKQISNYL